MHAMPEKKMKMTYNQAKVIPTNFILLMLSLKSTEQVTGLGSDDKLHPTMDDNCTV